MILAGGRALVGGSTGTGVKKNRDKQTDRQTDIQTDIQTRTEFFRDSKLNIRSPAAVYEFNPSFMRRRTVAHTFKCRYVPVVEYFFFFFTLTNSSPCRAVSPFSAGRTPLGEKWKGVQWLIPLPRYCWPPAQPAHAFRPAKWPTGCTLVRLPVVRRSTRQHRYQTFLPFVFFFQYFYRRLFFSFYKPIVSLHNYHLYIHVVYNTFPFTPNISDSFYGGGHRGHGHPKTFYSLFYSIFLLMQYVQYV